MKRYFFSGVVHPSHIEWQLDDFELKFTADGYLCLASIRINTSQIIATVETANSDVKSVASYLAKSLSCYADVYTFPSAYRSVELISSIDESKYHLVFGCVDKALEQEKSSNLDYTEIQVLADKCDFLRRALLFFRLAKQSSPTDTANFCWLAITSLINFCKTNRKTDFIAAKNKFQKHLLIDSNLLETLENLGDGSRFDLTWEDRARMLIYTSRIIDRFFHYAHGNYNPLPTAKFSLLTDKH